MFGQRGHVLVLRDEERAVPAIAAAATVGLPPVFVRESKGQQFGNQAGRGQIQRLERLGFRREGPPVVRRAGLGVIYFSGRREHLR